MNSTDLQPVSIVDVILNSVDKGRYVQTFVVISRPIRWIYTPAPFNKNLLIGRDGPFYDCLLIAPGTNEAFAGRKFYIRMNDGSDYECNGQAWSHWPTLEERNKLGIPETRSVGQGLIESLSQCYVFCSGHIDASLLEEWLSTNKTSSNYGKYDARGGPEYTKKMVRDGLFSYNKNSRSVSKSRAKELRSAGVTVWTKEGKHYWSPMAERKIKELVALRESDPWRTEQ